MSIKQKIKDFIDRITNSSCIGIIYAVLSTLLFSYAYFAAQQVIHSTPNFPILELVFVRSIVQVILMIPIIIIWKKRVLFERERWWNLLALTLVGYWCLVSGYWALGYIPASILLPISATCPLFALVFSYFILKEKCYALDAICGVLGFIGVVIICRPTFIFGNYEERTSTKSENISAKQDELSYLFGCLIAVLFGVGKALLITLIRKWARDSNENSPDQTPTILYPSIFGAAITPALMVFAGEKLILPGTGYAIFSLFAASIFTLLGSYALACAMRTQTSPVVGVIRNLDIVWVFLLQFAALNVWPSIWSIGGAVIIVCATILACFRERLFEKAKCFKCCNREYEEIKSEEINLEKKSEEDNVEKKSEEVNIEEGHHCQ